LADAIRISNYSVICAANLKYKSGAILRQMSLNINHNPNHNHNTK